jgi:putative phosphoesterase
MRYAFFSDIHSNAFALEAVLADVADVGVDQRYVLGDLVGYAPWPNEVLDRLRAEGIPVVMGNYDDGTGFARDECGCAYTHPVEKALGDAGFAWTKANTSDTNKAWLRTLAPQIRFEADGQRFLLVHGSPRRMNEYLYEDKPDSTFARIAADANADVIVCGHTHRPYDKTVAGTRFINDGSAGKPKDGDPRACWALVETSPTGVSVAFRRVEYDIDAASHGIMASELPHEFAAQLIEARGFRA